MMQFTQFSLSDDDSSFTANVAVGGKALNLQKIRLTHRGVVQLEGDALLPLDIWQQWPNVSLDQLLTPDVVSRVALTARKLDLGQASLLTGWKFPIGGIIDGTFTADGSINALKLGGALSLAQGRIPLDWSGDVISGVTAQLSFHDDAIAIERFNGAFGYSQDSGQARHIIVSSNGKPAYGEIQLSGEVRLSNLLDPMLDITVRSPRFSAPIFKSGGSAAVPVSAGSALELAINGPVSGANVKGTATLLELSLERVLPEDSMPTRTRELVRGLPDVSDLWTQDQIQLPRIFSFPSAPWSAWQFGLACKTTGAIRLGNNPGTVEANIKITGPGASPNVQGRVQLENVTGAVESLAQSVRDNPVVVFKSAVVDFSPARSSDPSIDAEVSGSHQGSLFWATLTGPLSQLMRTYDGPAPLTDNAVRDALRGHPWPVSDEFSLEVYPPVTIEAGFGRIPLE